MPLTYLFVDYCTALLKNMWKWNEVKPIYSKVKYVMTMQFCSIFHTILSIILMLLLRLLLLPVLVSLIISYSIIQHLFKKWGHLNVVTPSLQKLGHATRKVGLIWYMWAILKSDALTDAITVSYASRIEPKFNPWKSSTLTILPFILFWHRTPSTIRKIRKKEKKRKQ